jgi:hypothetical protein
LARTADQFRRTDVTFWGLVAVAAAGLALVSANVSALLPASLFSGLHGSRAVATAAAAPTAAPAELAALRGELAGLTTALAQTKAAGERRDTRFDDLIEQAGAVRGRLDTLEAVLRAAPPRYPADQVTDGTVTGAIAAPEPPRAALADDRPGEIAQPVAAGAPLVAEETLPAPDEPMPRPLPAPVEVADTPSSAAAATEPELPVAAPTAVSEVAARALPQEPADGPGPTSLGALHPAAPADHNVPQPAPPVETAIVDPPSPATTQSSARPRPAAGPDPAATLPLPRPRPASAAGAGPTASAVPATHPAAAAPEGVPARPAPGIPAEPAVGVAVGAPVEPSRAFAAWQDLAARIGVLLVGTSPVLAENPGGGQVLVAGPIESIATANRLCKEIVAAGIACKPVSYAGARIGASGA